MTTSPWRWCTSVRVTYLRVVLYITIEVTFLPTWHKFQLVCTDVSNVQKTKHEQMKRISQVQQIRKPDQLAFSSWRNYEHYTETCAYRTNLGYYYNSKIIWVYYIFPNKENSCWVGVVWIDKMRSENQVHKK